MSYLASLIPSLESAKSAVRQRLACLERPDIIYLLGSAVGPIAVGLALGAVLVYTRKLPADWAGLVVLATLAPPVVLLAKDIRKLLLVTFVIDIPVALDYTIGRRYDHLGGPGGFVVSLTTMVLVVGYGLWLIDRSGDDKPKVHVHKDITVPALVFFFTMLVSAFQAVDVRLSVTQLFLEAQFLLMYFYLINHVESWAHVRLIVTTLTVCLLMESTLMLLQYFGSFQISGLGVSSHTTQGAIASASTRVAGTIVSPNAAAAYLAVSLVIVFAGYLTDNWLVNKKLALVSFLPGVISLVLTQSRSAWGAFALAMLILIAQALRRNVGVKAILLVFIAALVIGAGFATQIEDRLTTDDYGSAESRVWYTKLAFNILNDRYYMFTGIGLNNLHSVMRDYLPLEMLEMRNWKFLHIIHNKYLIIWTETGLFGFLSFLWLLLAVGRSAFRSLRCSKGAYASIAITGLLAALVIFSLNMTTQLFTGRMRLQMLWCVFALIAAVSRLPGRQPVGEPV